jgi:hypothetical protein
LFSSSFPEKSDKSDDSEDSDSSTASIKLSKKRTNPLDDSESEKEENLVSKQFFNWLVDAYVT